MKKNAPVQIQDVINMNEVKFLGWFLIVFGIAFVMYNIFYPLQTPDDSHKLKNNESLWISKPKNISDDEPRIIPKPTLVTGYEPAQSGWYPLRGTWIKPTNRIVNNTVFFGNRLYLFDNVENVTVRESTFSANLSIQNSTNIVVAFANVTRNINITNMRDFRLLGEENALYYLNETPVSETIINDTIVFSPLVEPQPMGNGAV